MTKRTINQLLVITVIDYVLIWLFVYQLNPVPIQGLLIFSLVLIIIVVNFIIGLALYFLLKKWHKLFFMNALIASILMYLVLLQGINRYKNDHLNSWIYSSNDTTFQINSIVKTNKFNFTYKVRFESNTEFLTGRNEERNDTLYLTTDSMEYFIYANQLYNYNKLKSINLTELKY
jgi:hypothetical protein